MSPTGRMGNSPLGSEEQMLILNQGLHKGLQSCFMACMDDRCSQPPNSQRPHVVMSVLCLRASEQQPLESNGQVLRGTHLESPHFPGGRSPGPSSCHRGLQVHTFLPGGPHLHAPQCKEVGTKPQSLLLTQECPATCLLGEQQRMPANDRVTVAIFQRALPSC